MAMSPEEFLAIALLQHLAMEFGMMDIEQMSIEEIRDRLEDVGVDVNAAVDIVTRFLESLKQ